MLISKSVDKTRTRGRSRFRFEDVWFTKESCKELINSTWNLLGNSLDLHGVMVGLKQCGQALEKWGKVNFGQFSKRLKQCQERFEDLRRSLEDQRDLEAEDELEKEIEELLMVEEIWWKQRSRIIWLREGDRNTKIFHSRASQRKKKNTLDLLEDENGQAQKEWKEMEQIVLPYFKEIFCAGPELDLNPVLEVVKPRVSAQDCNMLDRHFSAEEIRVALFQMDPAKAPGPDGMTARFFQQCWATVGTSVTRACLDFLKNNMPLPGGLNETHVCLIPKTKKPKKMTELRPISLCNVLYKIISKSLANRLKRVLDRIISPFQSAFVPGRLITDNLLVASEALQYLKLKNKGKTGWMAVKLDVSKAYDRMEWKFIEAMLRKLGFSERWAK